MYLTGITIGAISFLSIGVFHVMKAEYHFSKICWPVFAIAGVALLLASTAVKRRYVAQGWP